MGVTLSQRGREAPLRVRLGLERTLTLAALLFFTISCGPPRAERLATIAASIEDRETRGAVTQFWINHPGTLDQDPETYATPEHFESLYPDSFWVGYLNNLPTNEEGQLAWEASHRMMALLSIYEATGQLRYLELAWKFSLAAMASRDDRCGLEDYQKRSQPAWGSSRYIPGKRTNFIVHSALVLEPILETLLALRGQLPLLSGRDETAPLEPDWAPPQAQEDLLRACLEAIDLYDDRFRVGLTEEEGYFLDDGSRSEPQPFNGQNIFAYDLQLAFLLSGREVYRERARAVMTFFANRLRVAPEGGYIWEYVAWPVSPRQPIPLEDHQVGQCEEISHGFVTVEPIAKMAHLRVVFGPSDLERFARTLSQQIYRREYQMFSTLVGCKIAYSPNYIGRLPGWLCLTENDPEAYALIERFMLGNVERPEPLYLAYLIKFDPDRPN